MNQALRKRAAQLVARESRYCLPYSVRVFLTGIALGIATAVALTLIYLE